MLCAGTPEAKAVAPGPRHQVLEGVLGRREQTLVVEPREGLLSVSFLRRPLFGRLRPGGRPQPLLRLKKGPFRTNNQQDGTQLHPSADKPA